MPVGRTGKSERARKKRKLVITKARVEALVEKVPVEELPPFVREQVVEPILEEKVAEVHVFLAEPVEDTVIPAKKTRWWEWFLA